ncbi:MAG: tetraacyldisaccharide 4'-kinase [bacterium]|nr:tetraacyldisaccharide 4'-kinase [Deltaproteobacteria bacterium]MCP4905112.1 tetraacyldisaccharide 4'-kinase [bacterium]
MLPRPPELHTRGGVGWRLAAFFYGLGARVHRAWMKRGEPVRGHLACAVVSVGALTVGGAGKTPVAARLALGLSKRGWRVVLASRGYRGGSRDRVRVVSDGSRVRSSVEESGDESLVLAGHAPGVPVLVGRDRRIVGHHAVSAFDAQILILDDGFQHHCLPRDLDIVCVDGIAGFGNGRLLPAGPLREPISVLGQADWLCLVDGGEAGTRGAQIRAQEAAGLEVIQAHRRPIDLVRIDRAAQRSADWLEGLRVGLLAGIARPASLRATIEGLGAEVVAERIFPDHHVYRAADCRALEDSAALWVTTEKDALKILPSWIEGASLFVLRIEAEIEEEPRVLEQLERSLRKAGRLA